MMSCVTFSFFLILKNKIFIFTRSNRNPGENYIFVSPKKRKRKVIFPVIYKPDVIAGPIALLYHRLKRKKRKTYCSIMVGVVFLTVSSDTGGFFF